eukprot:Skav207271  [mRNA]  locus=scaffold434:55751:55975:- [translate_table: standard]
MMVLVRVGVAEQPWQFAFVVFAFLIGFGIEASVGSAWLAHSANQNGTAEKAWHGSRLAEESMGIPEVLMFFLWM